MTINIIITQELNQTMGLIHIPTILGQTRDHLIIQTHTPLIKGHHPMN
jgi:hypothetical protein